MSRNHPWRDTYATVDGEALAPASAADLDAADRTGQRPCPTVKAMRTTTGTAPQASAADLDAVDRLHRPLSAALAAHAAPRPAVPAILGFGGWARSGKDTAAEMVIAAHGHRLLSFGTYVNALLLEVNPGVEVEPGRFERARDLFDRLGYEDAKAIEDYRVQLQNLGSAINDRDPGLWARLVLADLPPGAQGVITGVRSLPQLEAIRAVGGLTVWVDRPGAAPMNAHRNEQAVGPDDFDVVLDNSGDLRDLRITLDRLLAEHA